jgi:hypothetical protein
MWVIRHEETGEYFRAFEAPPRDDVPTWVTSADDAMQFVGLEEEEAYRNVHLPTINAQPFEV